MIGLLLPAFEVRLLPTSPAWAIDRPVTTRVSRRGDRFDITTSIGRSP